MVGWYFYGGVRWSPWEQIEISITQIDRHWPTSKNLFQPSRMVRMPMGEANTDQGQITTGDALKHLLGIVPCINHEGLFGGWISYQIAFDLIPANIPFDGLNKIVFSRPYGLRLR